jgi:YgiT-type zinc finger domain-containing protein
MMMEPQTFEYSPDDIGDEDVTLEWESRPAGEPPFCPHDGHPMTNQQHTYTLAGDRFVVTYEAWVCSECGEVFLDRQQARRYGAIQMLDRLLKERNGSPQGQVLFDGEDLFVNLSLARDMAALWRQTTSVMGR